MRKFQLTVHQYREKLESVFGYADEAMVKRYAEDRAAWKRGQISGTEDVYKPCKSCGKKKKK